ncbi:Extracellular Matrix protein PelA [hydrothermal vent metagenome]|uniref:Extracellular Matrix protein PelA n=1 Tax=hydrothermal vent metagenome TaxID=652676 RepID=A0A1W1BJV8_9ZZZZ
MLSLVTHIHASTDNKSAIVYYGDDIPYTIVGIHDYIILQPSHVNVASHGFKLYRDDIYAYVSIGEIESNQPYYKDISKEWIIGKNSLWSAKVMDISNKSYQRFMFEKVIEPLFAKGFKNIFFDTLDSYQIVAKSDKDREKYSRGLVEFINEFHHRYPDAKLIINRGFDIIDDVHDSIEAVLFESLFYGLSSKDLSYTKVSPSDREWLKAQISKIEKYHKPIIVVDYLPPDSKMIDKTIKKIEGLGLIPYIADRDLVRFGKSSKQATKREVLLLYDDTQFTEGTSEDDKIYSTAFLQLSMPLEYMGYIPALKPISTWKQKPSDSDRYAGAVVWINGTYATKNPQRFEKVVNQIKDSGIKLLMLESMSESIHPKLYKSLGITLKKPPEEMPKKRKMSCDRSYVGFEIDPYVPSIDNLLTPKDSKAICTLHIGKLKSTISAITPWGGYVFDGALMTSINKSDLWIANPFRLLRDTLRLPNIPIPDVTTQNGKRLLFVHIDGDGIMNRAEWNPNLFSGEVLNKEIFSKYHIPISLSIIEAETAPYGLYPKLSKRLEEIARESYAMEHIEPATHTFTHPFFWKRIVNDHLDPKYRLKVKDYNFSVDREIRGSLNYINKNLVPKGKKANMTFWSGDCLPTKTTLEYMYKNNFLQMNGGDTTISNKDPWLSYIAPLGIKRGDYYQVFTGAQNENVYTNDWLGPFWGFKRVIQTFKLTNAPRRFKPIDIYFHIYSGSKRASLNALHKVFQWAMKQDVMPIYTSEYIPRVMDFYEVSMARVDKKWYIKGTKRLDTIRISKDEYVDIDSSHGVVGMKRYLDSRYIHLDHNRSRYILKTIKKSPNQNYLIDSNARLVSHKVKEKSEEFRFVGHVPITLRYHLKDSCQLKAYPKPDKIDETGGTMDISYLKERDINVTIRCQ